MRAVATSLICLATALFLATCKESNEPTTSERLVVGEGSNAPTTPGQDEGPKARVGAAAEPWADLAPAEKKIAKPKPRAGPVEGGSVKKTEKKKEPARAKKAEERREEPAPGLLGPKETIETALKAIQAKDITPIFGLLPPSYAADLEHLVHEFAKAMDKEIFDKIVALTDRVSAILVKQKGEVVKVVAGFGLPAEEEDIKKAIDAAADAWVMLKKMGFTDLEKLKTFSLEKFAREDAQKLVEKAFALADSVQKTQVDMALAVLSGVRVEVLETTKDDKWGDVVKMSVVGEAEEFKMVKVDGKWVPTEMAEEWDGAMQKAMKGVKEMGVELPNAKTEILAQFTVIETMVDQIEKTGDLSTALQALGIGL